MASTGVTNGSPVAPDPTNIAEPDSISGSIQTATLAKDDPVPDKLDEDEEEGIVSRRRGQAKNVLDEDDDEAAPVDDDDLFGEGDEEELREEAEDLGDTSKRQLDDQELDSGDDEGRNDRIQSEQPGEEQERQLTYESGEIDRKPIPEPSDGEMYLLKVPNFLSIEPTMFQPSTFRPPTKEHHSRKEPSSSFSAFNTAMSTIRWRHSPSKPEEVQSNARILRWSDGSLTLQMASVPTQQYAINGNPLAPAQRNPVKPTPCSLHGAQKQRAGEDSYTYLTMPQPSVSLLRVTQRITTGLSVMPSESTTDEALERLQNSLAASVKRKGTAQTGNGSIEVVKLVEDPELARKQAEVAEREKMRAQKRREAAETRNRDGRGAGRARGYGGGAGGGLSTSLLEDDDAGVPRPRAKPKPRKTKYNDEYSSDEDLGRRRGNFANDDYEVDDFVAGSDEEEEVAEESEEDIDEGIREEPRKRSPKRSQREEDEDEDADGVDDDAVVAPKAKRRRAVLDEDDDDE